MQIISRFRKLQQKPSGVYYLHLPAEWVEGMGLEKGSYVNFSTDDDDNLILQPVQT
jgi:hypothetical protein